MRHLLDTNLIIYAVGGDSFAVNALQAAVLSAWVGYSAITRLELFGYPELTGEEEVALATVVGELEEVEVSSSIIDRAIRIRKSSRIKVPDAIIAATALEQDAVLLTRNKDDFKTIEGLTIVNPWDDATERGGM